MDTKKFFYEVESRLSSMAPEVIPGVLKKQLECLDIPNGEMTPEQAKEFVEKVSEALVLFIGPDGSKNAKKLMMRKLRQSCSSEELETLMVGEG